MNEIFQNREKGNGLTIKLLVLGFLVFITWVGTMFVWGLTEDRERRGDEAMSTIGEQWSRPQTIAGPVLTVPTEKITVLTTGERIVTNSTLTLLPKDLSYESEVETSILKRGVYETPVYTTVVSGKGSFDPSIVEVEPDTRVMWDRAVVSLNVSDTRGISSQFSLMLDTVKYEMLPSSEFTTLDGSGVHASVTIDPNEPEHTFSFELPLKGSREISFLPLGETTDVTVRSDWNAPSFTGEFLPEEREVTESGFNATWNVTSYGKNLPQYWIGDVAGVDSAYLLSKAFGVGLYQEVSFYTMVNRATKYSILFISLTFLTFFMYEVLSGLRIHPIQYLLVGLAIALFYLLLLSLAEVIGFLPAYLTSTVAITLLITSYCFSVLKAQKRAYSIAVLLLSLYGYLYILLQLEEFALLFGSALLFGVLATVMYITRNLDWYSLRRE